MDAYLPSSLEVFAAMAAIVASVPIVGFAIVRVPGEGWARTLAWLALIVGQLAAALICADEPAGFRMLAIIGTLLYSMKTVVAVEERVRNGTKLGPLAWLCWVLGWPGMRPELFADIPWKRCPGGGRLIARGVLELGIGVGLCVGARLAFEQTGSLVLATLLLLPGVSLCLHFGCFDMLAGAWRWVGVRSYRLFPAPLCSTSLSEFWGRRWNLPFTEMIQRGIYRPLSLRIGRDRAALIGFAFSGVLHELAISVPVREGFGLPLAYFAIHGALVGIERRRRGSGWLLERSRLFAHVWVLASLALPAAILFHPPFLAGVIWPLIGIG